MPVKPVRPKAKKPETAAKSLMDNQNRLAGDSKATRTEFIGISTTPEIKRAVEDAAHEERINKSRLVEKAIAAYLDLDITI